jgi:hypothetical protein
MENVVNAIAMDAKPSEIAAEIKNALFVKSAERIEAMRPQVAVSLFDNDDQSEEGEL